MIDAVLPVALLLAFAAGGALLCARSVRLAAAVGLPLLAVLLGKLVLGRVAAAESRLFPW